MNDESKSMPENKKLSDGKNVWFFVLIVFFVGVSALMVWSYFDLWRRMGWMEFSLGLKLWTFILIPIVTAGLLSFRLLAPHTQLNLNAMGRGICIVMIIASFLSPIGFALFRPIKVRHVDSYPKSALHSFYLACKSYWDDKGSQQNCNLKIAMQEEYGFVKSKYISIDGKGTAKDFTATAQHVNSTTQYTMDAEGNITEKK